MYTSREHCKYVDETSRQRWHGRPDWMLSSAQGYQERLVHFCLGATPLSVRCKTFIIVWGKFIQDTARHEILSEVAQFCRKYFGLLFQCRLLTRQWTLTWVLQSVFHMIADSNRSIKNLFSSKVISRSVSCRSVQVQKCQSSCLWMWPTSNCEAVTPQCWQWLIETSLSQKCCWGILLVLC